jgi:hypothetical protein
VIDCKNALGGKLQNGSTYVPYFEVLDLILSLKVSCLEMVWQQLHHNYRIVHSYDLLHFWWSVLYLTYMLPFLSGIVIHFKGEAAVEWSETETRTKPSTPTVTTSANTGNEGTTTGAAAAAASSIQNVTVNYSSHEQYFENKFNLLGGGSKYYILCNYCVFST